MSLFGRVIWSEGMFLRPQHFQQQDRHFDNLLRRCFLSINPYAWGFKSLDIDRDLLAVGKVSMPSCEVIMSDGSFIRIPEETDPPGVIDVGQNVRDAVVFLALPVDRVGRAPRTGNAGSSDIERRVHREVQVRDLTGASPEALADVAVEQLNVRILLETEERDSFHCIPAARVREVNADGAVVLDEAFIPTCVSARASRWLTTMVRELEGLVHQRAETMAGRVSQAGRGDVAEIADFLLLQALNRIQPAISHLTSISDVHPERLFQFLVEIAGELATFTRDEKRPQAAPAYQHERLAASFEPVMAEIRHSLSTVFEPTAMSIPFEERRFGIRVATIPDPTLIESAAFILAVSADMRPDLLARSFPMQAKVGTVEKIRELVNLAIPGVDVRQLPVAPRQIPFHAGTTYFELDTKTDLWKALVQSAGLALHVAGEFPNLNVALWAIRR